MMTIDEAIKHCDEVAQSCTITDARCGEDHIQLKAWLEELKELKEGNDYAHGADFRLGVLSRMLWERHISGDRSMYGIMMRDYGIYKRGDIIFAPHMHSDIIPEAYEILNMTELMLITDVSYASDDALLKQIIKEYLESPHFNSIVIENAVPRVKRLYDELVASE